MPKIEDTYLGDGVYASYSNGQLTLDTRAQSPVNTIYLERPVLLGLIRYGVAAGLVVREDLRRIAAEMEKRD